MHISHVEPNLETIQHYFDQRHLFYTKLDVHFMHNNRKLKAVLLFPFHKKGIFLLEQIEIFHHDQWTVKKGNLEQYGLALTNHHAVILLGRVIFKEAAYAKKKLDRRFQNLVIHLASRIEEEMESLFSIECVVNSDYLTILTKIELNGEMIEGRVETNYSFAHNMDDHEFLEELVANYKLQISNSLQKLEIAQLKRRSPQKIYITTIPLLNPIIDEVSYHSSIHVSIYCEGYCKHCHQTAYSMIKSNQQINLEDPEQSKLDSFITVLGEMFICDNCKKTVKKDKVVIKDINNGKILEEKAVEDLFHIVNMKDQEEVKRLILSAVNHDTYFNDHEEEFWNAFSYIAIKKWDVFVEELTRKELEYVLPNYVTEIPYNASKYDLLTLVRTLDLSESEKKHFWRQANEYVIEFYLFITIFGWNMEKEIMAIGSNRAKFIFQYLPTPEVLMPFFKVHASFFDEYVSETIVKLEKNNEQQKQQIRNLQQENGRLTEKLGQAHTQIIELEQASFSTMNENRNHQDILKIQQLKGLITELKEEMNKLTPQLGEKETFEKVLLTEKPIEKDPNNYKKVLAGKKILIMGGYRSKQLKEEYSISLFSHDARNLDPHFYEILNNADMIVILTRYISHHAMWEAKEHAILARKSIFYTTFTNIPTILSEVAREFSKRNENKNG